MAHQNFKIMVGSIAAFIVTVIRLIPSGPFDRGLESWTQWAFENGQIFAISALLTYAALSIWERVNYLTFKNFQRLCKKHWKSFYTEMTSPDQD